MCSRVCEHVREPARSGLPASLSAFVTVSAAVHDLEASEPQVAAVAESKRGAHVPGSRWRRALQGTDDVEFASGGACSRSRRTERCRRHGRDDATDSRPTARERGRVALCPGCLPFTSRVWAALLSHISIQRQRGKRMSLVLGPTGTLSGRSHPTCVSAPFTGP